MCPRMSIINKSTPHITFLQIVKMLLQRCQSLYSHGKFENSDFQACRGGENLPFVNLNLHFLLNHTAFHQLHLNMQCSVFTWIVIPIFMLYADVTQNVGSRKLVSKKWKSCGNLSVECKKSELKLQKMHLPQISSWFLLMSSHILCCHLIVSSVVFLLLGVAEPGPSAHAGAGAGSSC